MLFSVLMSRSSCFGHFDDGTVWLILSTITYNSHINNAANLRKRLTNQPSTQCQEGPTFKKASQIQDQDEAVVRAMENRQNQLC